MMLVMEVKSLDGTNHDFREAKKTEDVKKVGLRKGRKVSLKIKEN